MLRILYTLPCNNWDIHQWDLKFNFSYSTVNYKYINNLFPPPDPARMAGEEQVYLSVVRQDIVKYDMMVKNLVQVSCTEHTVSIAHPSSEHKSVFSVVRWLFDLVWISSECMQQLADD